MQLQAAQGHEDEEAVAALAQLKQNMATLARAEAVAAAASDRTAADAQAALDEVQLAGVLDRWVPTHLMAPVLPCMPPCLAPLR